MSAAGGTAPIGRKATAYPADADEPAAALGFPGGAGTVGFRMRRLRPTLSAPALVSGRRVILPRLNPWIMSS